MFDYVLSARLLLDTFSQGHLMRTIMGRVVQVMAIAVGISLLISWIGLWYTLGTLSGWAALALTFTQIVLIAAILKVVQVMYVRGEDIQKLPESDFTMMSIFATLVRLPGECALVFFALFSIPAMLLTWTGAAHIAAMFGVPAIPGHPFVAGVGALVTCWIIGFAALVAFSVLAEVISALYSIAHDLRGTRQALQPSAQSEPMTHARAA